MSFATETTFRSPLDSRIYQFIEIFGPNILTSEGDTWKRHRKVSGAFSFSERRMASVWREALRQASQLQNYWLSNKHRALNSTAEDAMVLTMHVLTFAAFDIAYPFRRGIDIPSTTDMDFRDAFSLLLRNFLIMAGVPRQILEMPFIPLAWAKVGQAIRTVEAYIQALIEKEKALYMEGSIGGRNLVSDLVRDSWDSRQATNFPQKGHSLSMTLPRMSLSEAEIFSNVFMFMTAGHDTVTQTLTYSILYLATYPKWQRWIAEEIQAITLDTPDTNNWDYEALFPRFKRYKAIMFEILRLVPNIAAVPKYTADCDQTITAAGKTFTIPRRTLVFPNMMAFHTHPAYWGADATSFRPSRWITTDAEDNHPESLGCPAVSSLPRESLLVPPRGFYFPWSDGPRACPGKKLAQVEVTAVLAYLFRDHFVEMVLQPNETFATAQQRFAAKLHEYSLMISVKIRDPKNMVVRWTQQ